MAPFLALVPLTRTVLYVFFVLCSFVTLCLGSSLLASTVLEFGVYHKATAELVAAGVLGFVVVIPLHLLFHRRPSTHVLSTTWVELVILGALNLLFLGGSVAQLGGVSYCGSYFMCELPAAFRAFAWLGWISSFLLISLVVVAALMEKRPEIWREQFAVGRMQEAVKNKEEAEAEHIRMIEARGVTV